MSGRVAVVGLGKMGCAIAERVERAGHRLTVWNRSPEAVRPFVQRGACAAASPADVWAQADVVLSTLAGPDAVRAVLLGSDGLLSAQRTGTLVEMSTIDAATSAEVAVAAAASAIGYLRAPVSGNPSVVRAGDLGIIVSGPRTLVERLRPLLAGIGRNLFVVGEGEQARYVKLALNLVLGGTAELLAEALVLTEAHGVDRRMMLETMSGSAVGSPLVRYKTDALVADDYVSTFTTLGLVKDLSMALAAGASCGVPLPLAEQTRALLAECVDAGRGEEDFMVLLPRLRQAAGLD